MSARQRWTSAACILIGSAIGYAIPVEWVVSPLFMLIVGLASGALLALMLVRL